MAFLENNKLTRAKAKEMCLKNNVMIGTNFSLSNATERGDTFANTIPIKKLSQDFWLLLNDQYNNELHIFKVPANSIPINEMYQLSDKPSIFIKIYCNDENFQDDLSVIRFDSWLVKTIKY